MTLDREAIADAVSELIHPDRVLLSTRRVRGAHGAIAMDEAGYPLIEEYPFHVRSADDACMVAFRDTDGHMSLRSLTIREVVNATIDAIERSQA